MKSFAALGIVAIVVISVYAVRNSSAHTGWEPFTAYLLFVPLAIAGGGSLKKIGPAAAVAFAVGLAGIALIVWLDRTNRLVQYERWIERGMP